MTAAFSTLKNLARAQRKVDAFVREAVAKPLAPTDVLMRGRPESTDNVGRTLFKTLPVQVALKLLKKTPKIDNQRNEEAREPKATYLENLDLPQAIYHVAYVEDEGKFYLLDGNTRKLRLFSRRLADFFRELHLVFHLYANKQEALAAYHTFDSKKARKSGRNDLEGAFRAVGYAPEKFNSPALKVGGLVTVVKNLARASFGVANASNVALVVEEYAQYFSALDSVGLQERNPPAGAILACVLVLETPGTEGKWEYVREYLRGIKSVYAKRATHEVPSEFFVKLRQKADTVCFSMGWGTSGEAPCKLMAPVFMDHFAEYLKAAGLREGKRSLLNKQLSAEVVQLSAMLRDELANKVEDRSKRNAA